MNRKFVVKPFKPMAPLANRAVIDHWNILQGAMLKIFKHQTAQLSFADLHLHAYKLVVDKHGAMVYARVYDALTAHFTAKREEIIQHRDSTFLQGVQDVWLDSLKILTSKN